jgi:hypothetical protein
MEEENCSESNQSTRGRALKLFSERTKEYANVKVDSLPTTEKKIQYFSKEPSFVLAFLNDFMDQSLENKLVFMDGFLQDIQPSDFDMRFDGEQIELKFTFEVDEEDEETLKLVGKLYQSEGKKVGIDWIKVAGNDFWLNKIVKDLNQSLSVLE